MLSDSFDVKEQEFFYEVQGQASSHAALAGKKTSAPDITQRMAGLSIHIALPLICAARHQQAPTCGGSV